MNVKRVAYLLRQLAHELDPQDEAPRPRKGRTATLLEAATPTDTDRAAANKVLFAHGLTDKRRPNGP